MEMELRIYPICATFASHGNYLWQFCFTVKYPQVYVSRGKWDVRGKSHESCVVHLFGHIFLLSLPSVKKIISLFFKVMVENVSINSEISFIYNVCLRYSNCLPLLCRRQGLLQTLPSQSAILFSQAVTVHIVYADIVQKEGRQLGKGVGLSPIA